MSIFMRLFTWFIGTKGWAWFTKRVLSRMNMRLFGNPKFPMKYWYQIEPICNSNQEKLLVFVSNSTKLSSVLIRLVSGSEWTHAGVLLSRNGKVEVVHMESVGLLRQVLLELLREVDDFAIIEIPLTDKETRMAKAIMESYLQSRPSYDFQFLMNNKGIYCSELIYEMVKFTGRFKTHVESGRKVFEPSDVYQMGRVLFEYRTKK